MYKLSNTLKKQKQKQKNPLSIKTQNPHSPLQFAVNPNSKFYQNSDKHLLKTGSADQDIKIFVCLFFFFDKLPFTS